MKPLHISVLEKQFMKQTIVMAQLGPLHIDIIQAGKEYFNEIKEEALLTIRQI